MAYTTLKLVNFGPSYTGLAAVGYQLRDADAGDLGAHVVGVAERGTLSGTYGVEIEFADDWHGEIAWDTGTTPNVFASEEVLPIVATDTTSRTASKATVVDLNADQSGVTVGIVTLVTTTTTNTDMRGTDGAITSALVSGADVTVKSVVTADLNIEIVQYDDYLNANGRPLIWTNSGGDWFDGDLTDATVALTMTESDGTFVLTTAGAVVTATGTQAVSVELTSAQTALFIKPGNRYVYQLLLNKATFRETEVTGDVVVTLTNSDPE